MDVASGSDVRITSYGRRDVKRRPKNLHIGPKLGRPRDVTSEKAVLWTTLADWVTAASPTWQDVGQRQEDVRFCAHITVCKNAAKAWASSSRSQAQARRSSDFDTYKDIPNTFMWTVRSFDVLSKADVVRRTLAEWAVLMKQDLYTPFVPFWVGWCTPSLWYLLLR